MSCMFSGLQIVECEVARQFTRPLTTPQKEYLEALDLTEEQLLMYDGGGNGSGYG